MATGRLRSFDVPHKGIRNGLSQLSLLSGKTDYGDPEEVERLHRLGSEIFLLLNTHARDENGVSLKHLEEKMNGASHHDTEEHIRLHVDQSALEKKLEAIHAASKNGKDASAEGESFYAALADFHAEYLQHMSEEERITQQLLWEHFSDEELAAHRAEIMQKLQPEVLLLWFKYIAPAQTRRERAGLFKGFKANAPGPLFKRTKEILAEVLTRQEYDALMQALD